MGIDDAKKLIELSVSSGYYSKNEKGEYELVEHLKSEKIPLGFKPTDAIFSTIVVKPDPIEGVLRAVAQASGKEPMILASELQRIRSHYDNLIADNAGVIMLARCYNVDISVYMPDLLKSIEKE